MNKENALNALRIAVKDFIQACKDNQNHNQIHSLYGTLLAKIYFCELYEDEKALQLLRKVTESLLKRSTNV